MRKNKKVEDKSKYIGWIGLGCILGFFLGILATAINDSVKQYLPDSQILLKGTTYELAYDVRTKNPAWVFETLDKANPKINYSSAPKTFETFHLEDYKHSNLVPVSLVMSVDITFELANTSPLNFELAKGFWQRLNTYILHLQNQIKASRLLILTEPLFLPEEKSNQKIVSYELIGKNNVAVPTHILRAVFYLADDPSAMKDMHDAFTMAAPLENTYFHPSLKGKIYLIPNKPIAETTDLETFRMTNWDEIQQLPGVVFPPSMARYLAN